MKLSWQLNVYCVESNVSDFNEKNTKLSDMFFFCLLYFPKTKLTLAKKVQNSVYTKSKSHHISNFEALSKMSKNQGVVLALSPSYYKLFVICDCLVVRLPLLA